MVHAPVHASNDTADGSRSLSVENLDSDESRFLGDTVGLSCNSAGNVGSVTILVLVDAVDVVGAPDSAVFEIGMADIDASVDIVRSDARTSRVIIVIVSDAGLSVRNTTKTPGRGISLRHQCVECHHLIGFDEGHLMEY